MTEQMINDNMRRQRNAQHALEAYQDVSDIGNEEEGLSDLIADLGHYADRHQVDFLDCCTSAIAHWSLERQTSHSMAATPRAVIQIGGAQ